MDVGPCEDPEDYLRMVLVGRTGAGKSAVGNTILMERGFESSGCSFSVTKVCQRESGKVQGQKLEVIDTPGLFNTELSNERVTAEIANCIAYASPGPHVFLIILKAERFTKEEEETVEILQNLFGEQAARYTMALFTRGDDLEADGVTIEDVICKNQVLRAFLHQCKGGYHVFNNRNKDPAQVHELLKKINTIVKRNGGRCYTNEMFQEAEKAKKDYLRMVLVGKTGTGKSAVGNTILMKKEKVFPSSACADSLTKVCRRESEKVQGQKLEVIDTPGLFDTELSNEQVKAEISKCIAYASPGPHVFLIILKADRFTTEEEETVAILQKLFGEQAACYTMALFTRGDDLEADGVTIEDVIGKNKVLRAFLHQCKGGYHVFNNRNEDPAQVHELLKKINTMVEKNGGRYYTNEMFQEAEKAKKDSLRMVLVGKCGTGISAAGNTILMRKGFHSSVCSSSVTKTCKRVTTKVQGQILEVIDTPGLFDTELSNEQVKAEIAKCIAYASPGPHVFLIILKADRFTTEEEETVNIIQNLFGEQAARYTMALFTHGDDLEADGVTIEDVIGRNKVLRAFLHQCKGGYHVFNNRNKDPAQVHELLKKINTMVEDNGGSYYTNEMFQEAEEAVQKEMNELLKDEPQRDRDDARTVGSFIAGLFKKFGAGAGS
ncbi:GTPase IMAP family member 8-like [Limanda limanda]|uniref:GTPase IMAP family member 8-like n=1 Tax=Limanda limanda TaxID=27771 RepID=UPI0029C9A723|nr:GTPase IMAP family member 8-like [Limanda limanda]